MRTIGRTYTGSLREIEDVCDYCGVSWHRKKLRLDAAGFLACPDDSRGRTAIEIDAQRAADSSEADIIRGKTRQGAM